MWFIIHGSETQQVGENFDYPCAAELFPLHFLSFEAGIANAISASSDKK